MKIIDTHVHFYTCERTAADVKYLEGAGCILPGVEGAIEGLKKHMKLDGIDISVNAPSALSPQQAIETNRVMIKYNEAQKEVICLGTMHPGMEDAKAEAEYLSTHGIKGVKMHPQVQGFYPDDESMKKIYKACDDEGLYMLFHSGAGSEPVFDYDTIKSAPKRFSGVIDSFPSLKLVLAHLGGLNMWDEAREYIIGKNLYLDTAYCTIMPDEEIKNIIKHHGADKILFGSDFPWIKQKDIKTILERCVPDEAKRELIFYKNAKKLLGL